MRFRASSTWPILPHQVFRPHHISHPAVAAAALLRRPATPSRALHATPSSENSGGGGGGGGGAQGNYLLVPGAAMATILMLGILHARRLYDDKKNLQQRKRFRIVVEDMKEKGIELEFSPGFILEDSTFSSHLTLLGVPDDNARRQLSIESELQTNSPRRRWLQSEPPDEHGQDPKGAGMLIKKGEEVAASKMRSTVVLVFQAPVSESLGDGLSSDFRFCIKSGDKVKAGESIGRWSKP